MRLWHYKLIPLLPRLQLLGQHRECCAMRGKFWGRKHKTVDYVWKYGVGRLFNYHFLVMNEMLKRNYNIEKKWLDISYCGKQKGYNNILYYMLEDYRIYPEHNDTYLQECLDNLKAKGIIIKA